MYLLSKQSNRHTYSPLTRWPRDATGRWPKATGGFCRPAGRGRGTGAQGAGEGATAKPTRRLSGAHHAPCTRSRRKEAAPIEGLGESGVDRRGMGCDARISRIRHARHGYR